MAVRTTMLEVIPEGGSWDYSTDLELKKSDGMVVKLPLSLITSIELTLYALDAAKTIINLVDHIDIKNAGRGTVVETATATTLTIEFEPDDAQILDASHRHEHRIALIEIAWSPTKRFPHEVQFTVENLSRVP
jgi:hypothetical protein